MKLTREEEKFGKYVLGLLGGESFVKSSLEITNLLISTSQEGNLIAELRWKKRQNKGINGLKIQKDKHDDFKMFFTSFGKHNKDKKAFSKTVEKYDNVIQRQIPDLFEAATGFSIESLKNPSRSK